MAEPEVGQVSARRCRMHMGRMQTAPAPLWRPPPFRRYCRSRHRCRRPSSPPCAGCSLPPAPPRLPARQQVSHKVTHVIFDMDGLLLGEPQRPPSLSCRVFSTVPLTACLLPAKQACRRHSSTAPCLPASSVLLACCPPCPLQTPRASTQACSRTCAAGSEKPLTGPSKPRWAVWMVARSGRMLLGAGCCNC